MHFAKLNNPPSPSKVLEKKKSPPGGLNRGFTVLINNYLMRLSIILKNNIMEIGEGVKLALADNTLRDLHNSSDDT